MMDGPMDAAKVADVLVITDTWIQYLYLYFLQIGVLVSGMLKK